MNDKKKKNVDINNMDTTTSDTSDSVDTIKINKKKKNVEIELDSLKELNFELDTKYKKSLADLINFKNRAEEDKRVAVDYSVQKFLFPIFDNLKNFESLQMHLKDESFDICIKKFKQDLELLGLKEYNPLNELFDANKMDGAETDNNPDLADNIVTSVFEKGYIYKDKLIKPAKVKVNKIV